MGLETAGIASGAVGLAGSIASLLSDSKNPFPEERERTKKAIEEIYEKERLRMRKEISGQFDSDITETANQSAMAGSVAGVANTSRLGADTTSRIIDKRNQAERSVDMMITQQKTGALQQNEDVYGRASAEFEYNKPNFFTKVDPLLNVLQTIPGQNATMGAVGALTSLPSLFKGQNKTKVAPKGIVKGVVNRPIDNSNLTWQSPNVNFNLFKRK